MENDSDRRGHTYPGDLQFPKASEAHLGDSFTTNIYGPSFDALWHKSIIQHLRREVTWDDLWNVAAQLPGHKSHPAHPKTQLASDQGDEWEWNSGTNPRIAGGTHPVAIGESAYKTAYEKAKRYWIEQGNWNDEYNDPYHQFMYQQVPRERKRIECDAGISTADINTQAYNNIRQMWVRRCIWNTEWGLLPGMKWMHQEVRYEEITHSPIQANHPGNDTPKAVDVPTQPVLEPVQSNHYQESGNSGVKEVPQDALDGLVKCQIEQSPLLSNSPTARNNNQAPRPSTRPTPLRSKRRRSQRKNSRSAPLTSVPQRSGYSRTSKNATNRTRPGPQRQSDFSERGPSSYSLACFSCADHVDELSLPFRDAS
ncbi:hypothetical protein N431DRAFT_561492 [Stipitochalara longipes BDJ]|nr:hypothetical protein N431DRAFT_561492 [Stipitochalara longipes BDJ]